MNTAELNPTVTHLISELVYGVPKGAGYILNSGDKGLMSSLDRLSAEAASRTTPTGSSIASHTDHLRYGISLLNRWADGENPFEDADWTASWQRTEVSDAEWSDLRSMLREEVDRWMDGLKAPRDLNQVETNGIVGSVAHLAYHLGAIRQIDSSTRGPTADES